MQAGAIGFSGSRQKGHFDPQGVPIPALWADEREVFALADVLRELGTGTVQMGGGVDPELADGMMARMAEACGCPVIYNSLSQTVRTGDKWKQHIARVDETARAGILPIRCAAWSCVYPGLHHEELPGVPRAADLASDPDPIGMRTRCAPMPIRRCATSCMPRRWSGRCRFRPPIWFSKTWWDYMWVNEPALEKNKALQFKTIGEIAKLHPARDRRVP